MAGRLPLLRHFRRNERANEVRHEAVIGQVVDNQDPDKLGRIKIKLPTFSEEDSTHWATLSSLGAGKDRGWHFLPEIDDEVLVMFADGDVGRPVILGALWNGQDNPPESNGGSNPRRVLVSREGHKVVFDDDAGTITFTDGGGKGTVTISEDAIKLESTGDAVISAPQGDLDIVAKDIEMTASVDLTMSGKSKIAMSGSNVTLKGGGSLQINGAVVQINPGGTPEASEVSDSCANIADPIGD